MESNFIFLGNITTEGIPPLSQDQEVKLERYFNKGKYDLTN